jgi:hypothetical protein
MSSKPPPIEPGPRTALGTALLETTSISVPSEDGKHRFEYHVLSQSNDFAQKQYPLVSYGMNPDRELILVNAQAATILFEQWEKFLAKRTSFLPEGLASLPEPTRMQSILNLANEFAQEKLGSVEKNRNIEKEVAQLVQASRASYPSLTLLNEIKPRTAMTIIDFTKKSLGVCRHHSLVNGLILGMLVEKGIIPKGTVRQFRDEARDDTINTVKGAHTILTYCLPDGSLWVFDSLNRNKPFELDLSMKFQGKYANAKEFMAFVGKDFYRRILTLGFKGGDLKAGAEAAAEPQEPKPVLYQHGDDKKRLLDDAEQKKWKELIRKLDNLAYHIDEMQADERESKNDDFSLPRRQQLADNAALHQITIDKLKKELIDCQLSKQDINDLVEFADKHYKNMPQHLDGEFQKKRFLKTLEFVYGEKSDLLQGKRIGGKA